VTDSREVSNGILVSIKGRELLLRDSASWNYDDVEMVIIIIIIITIIIKSHATYNPNQKTGKPMLQKYL
jgi:hypothetical protein